MVYSTKMNYIDVTKETMIHYDYATPEIKTYEDYTKFVGSANATKIFQIAEWQIGMEGVQPININSVTEMHIYVG